MTKHQILKDNTMMNRRDTFKWLGAATCGLCYPGLAYQSTDRVPIVGVAPDDPGNNVRLTPPVVCRVVGIGSAGSNIVLAAWSSGLLHADGCDAEFACVSLSQQSIRDALHANCLHPDIAPIRTVQLGRFGANGNVNIARAAARKHEGALRSLVAGADMVILVAGLGGGCGSGLSPQLAQWAREAGALTMGVIVTPFNWELGRYPNAFQGVKGLERESHYLVSLSNEKMGSLLGMNATLDDVITQQEALARACLQRLLIDGSRFCIDRWRCRPA